MILDYGFGTMTATTFNISKCLAQNPINIKQKDKSNL